MNSAIGPSMTDERIAVIRDTVAGIQAQCALLLALIGQMQTNGAGRLVDGSSESVQTRQGQQHYGEEPKKKDPLAERLEQIAGAKAPHSAPAGASLQED